MESVQIRSFFWSVFIRIQTEYGDVLRIFPYSVQMQENTDQKKLCIWTLFTQWKLLLNLKLDHLTLERSERLHELRNKNKLLSIKNLFYMLYELEFVKLKLGQTQSRPK